MKNKVRAIKKTTKQFIPQRGFTLIELLVVIVIVGILSSLGIVNYLDARLRARDAQRKANLAQLQSALEFYRQDQAAYPAALPACGSPLKDPTNVTTYIQKVPCDPTNSSPHMYHYAVDGSTYTLLTCLENVKDAQRDMPASNPPCDGTKNWSYTVTNP